LQFFPLNFSIDSIAEKLEFIPKNFSSENCEFLLYGCVSGCYSFTATKAKIKGREIYLPSSSQQVEPVSLTSFRIASQFHPENDFKD